MTTGSRVGPSIALFPLVVLLFPDARLQSRRWRWVLWVYGGLISLVTAVVFLPALSAVVHHRINVDASGNLVSSGKPSGGAGSVVAALVVCSIGAIWVSFVVHQFRSWRRSTGERRQQLKWVMCGAAIALVGGVLGSVFSSSAVGSVLFFGIIALPVSIGVAILKYRLYEIDRFISRTLAYAIVTGLVVGVYVGVVTLVTKGLGFSSPIAVAASTLAAVALFNPLRVRIQRVVDRRFNRAALRRGCNRRGIHGSAPRRRRPRDGAKGAARGRQPGCRARTRVGVDPAAGVRRRNNASDRPSLLRTYGAKVGIGRGSSIGSTNRSDLLR